MTQVIVELWHDDDSYCNDDDEIIGLYNSCKQRKVWKKQIKRELLPMAWHPF